MGMLLRLAEFGMRFHSLGFRHLRGDLLQEVEALIRKGVGPPDELCVPVRSKRSSARVSAHRMSSACP